MDADVLLEPKPYRRQLQEFLRRIRVLPNVRKLDAEAEAEDFRHLICQFKLITAVFLLRFPSREALPLSEIVNSESVFSQ